MTLYAYTAVDAQGQGASGAIDAPSRANAVEHVMARGLFPVTVEEKAAAPRATPTRVRRRGRVRASQVEAFTRELASLLAAGVPLGRALQVLSRETASPAAKQMWETVHDDVMNGDSLADALAKWSSAFSAVNVAMVRAGETGGFLDLVLSQIAEFHARERELLGKVKAAMIYPAILSALMVAVVCFLLTYFIPKFQVLFDEFGKSLPVLTSVIVAASHAAVKYGAFVVVGAVVIVFAARRAIATELGARRLERVLLALPAVGAVLARFALIRFCRMVGTLVGAGVPLVAALQVARGAIGNMTLADAVNRAIDNVKGGEALSKGLELCPALFPPSVIEMVAVAEESGRLDKELVRQAESNEQELDRRLRMLVAVVEPALLFVMAALVGTIVVGMLLPVFTLQEMVK